MSPQSVTFEKLTRFPEMARLALLHVPAELYPSK
jgi:hypothetical protein